MNIFVSLLFWLVMGTSYAGGEFKSPIVYGVSPLYLSYGHDIPGLKAVTARLSEMAELGITVMWMQPITPPFEEDGHGYDVMDYKSVWSKLGTSQDLKNLVKEAHRKNIRVMLDVVLNHSSEHHPFVKDIEKLGTKSRYYHFYQHRPLTSVPYKQFFHSKKIGGVDFIYYFWEHLLNFDYSNKALRDYMLDVLAHWIREYDIDGFRFDASWGPSSRYPSFYKDVSKHLRAIKPSVILMAEDMAGYPIHYKGSGHPHLKNSGFDWAYDWNNQDQHWISKWSFQRSDDQGETIFNEEDPEVAAELFMKAANFAQNTSGISPVRYIENNDTPGFLKHHSLEEAKWAAKIMFMLPGIPLIFYGQEAGNKHELFELPSFDPARKMSSFNPGLWKFYKSLISLRQKSPPLNRGRISEMKLVRPGLVSFIRQYQKEKIVVELDFETKTVRLNSKPL